MSGSGGSLLNLLFNPFELEYIGKVDNLDNQYIMSEFVMLALFPLFPIGGKFITGKSRKGEFQGYEIRLSLKSVALAYLRRLTGLYAIVFFLFCLAFLFIEEFRKSFTGSLPEETNFIFLIILISSVLLFGGLWAGSLYYGRRPGKTDRAKRQILGAGAGLNALPEILKNKSDLEYVMKNLSADWRELQTVHEYGDWREDPDVRFVEDEHIPLLYALLSYNAALRKTSKNKEKVTELWAYIERKWIPENLASTT